MIAPAESTPTIRGILAWAQLDNRVQHMLKRRKNLRISEKVFNISRPK